MNFKDIYKQQMNEIHVPETLLEHMAGDRTQPEGREKVSVRKWNRRLVAAVIIGLLFVGSATAYAGAHLFRAKEVALKMEEPKIANEFEKISPECQIQEDDGYKITYLGSVTGKKLSENDLESDEKKTYYVVAVQRKDGGEMSLTDGPRLVVTPFVRGYAPWHFNFILSGGESAQSQIVNNVRYYLVESESVEIYAAHGVYLGISEGMPSSAQYNFDKKTGEITANKKYKGINVLFELSIDPSKADEKQVKKNLKAAGIEE